ncbi:hypothetical protein FRC04_012155 [Tulasnella sp. 424]|nr:hypothetical protein FRC04_012155 [Tulasnella sp. 424]KAG8971037.1 hypothetical protein FRC05_011503 [Tulasnella sp. 425]
MELLVEVLLNALNDTEWSTEDLQRLASVCKYWREVILKTPQFWRIMDAGHGRDAWSRVLSRNSGGALDVRIWGFDHGVNGADADRLWEFANLLKPESRRIRSIESQAGLSLGYIQSFLDSSPFPLLSDIKLLVSPAPPTPYVFDVGDGVPFQHLHLGGVVIPWDSPRLSGLETITLWGIHQNAPTISALHRILSLAPRLRRLSLFSWTNTTDFDDPSSEELPTITLPLLSSLVIKRVCNPVNSRLLSMLEAPMLEDIRWLSVGGLDSGITLLRLSKGCIQAAPELAIYWTEWTRRFLVRSEPWSDPQSSKKPTLSEKAVDIGIDGIEDPSQLMGVLATLLCPSHKVLFTASSERVMPSVTDILRGSGAKFSVRVSEFI